MRSGGLPHLKARRGRTIHVQGGSWREASIPPRELECPHDAAAGFLQSRDRVKAVMICISWARGGTVARPRCPGVHAVQPYSVWVELTRV